MGKKKKPTQYHQAFCAATELEFRDNKAQLAYYPEYAISMKIRQSDLLIVKRDPDAKIHSGLGAIFKKYNLFEYKSPDQALGFEQYQKTLANAILLEDHLKKKEHCTRDDFTISFVRKRMPRKLMGQLQGLGFQIVQFQPGIYYVTRSLHVDMQIIVTSRLGKEYLWITKLTNQLKRADLELLYHETTNLTDPMDRSNAEDVLDLVMWLNQNAMKEELIMGMLRDLFTEEFKQEFEIRDNKIAELNQQLQSKDEQIQSQNEELQSKDEQLQNKDAQLQNKDVQLQNKDAQLQSKNKQIVQLKKELDRLQKLFGDQIAML